MCVCVAVQRYTQFLRMYVTPTKSRDTSTFTWLVCPFAHLVSLCLNYKLRGILMKFGIRSCVGPRMDIIENSWNRSTSSTASSITHYFEKLLYQQLY